MGLKNVPAITRQLPSHILEVVVAHVVDAKDKEVLVLRDTFSDVGEEQLLLLARLLGHVGHVDHFCSF